ncbi:Protein of unknown function [Bacillus cytotoxicus]|uniref:Uncharacterized protein n=1 Tax=Bacillus cytotoxicus TaxID=580165 RepID=A0AAX2CFP1_9BACI|nr:Protein of unknown function [Bacillus cytotoxicus]SCN34711.1 Protein of unknown function [Bacillus cytotoxicus]
MKKKEQKHRLKKVGAVLRERMS